jgi:hypothetical protein
MAYTYQNGLAISNPELTDRAVFTGSRGDQRFKTFTLLKLYEREDF